MQNFTQKYEELRLAFEQSLEEYLAGVKLSPGVLNDSFRYTLRNGGKRVRPVLMYACAQMFGGKITDVSGFALALEMIHTYSLIHDDLPAMDNDDYRRGELSSHKKFGEGQAILAGDALLNEAYAVCLEECRKGRTYQSAAALFCKNAGAYGMVAGQAADLQCQGGGESGKEQFEFIVLNKTAKMIMTAAAVPATVYASDENIQGLMLEFGKNFGFLFQITDDILDVNGTFDALGKTTGKDAAENKLSAVNLFGMEESVRLADMYRDICLKILDQLPYESEFLCDLVQNIRRRDR